MLYQKYEVGRNMVLVLTTHYLQVISPTVKSHNPHHAAGTPGGRLGSRPGGLHHLSDAMAPFTATSGTFLNGYASEREDVIAGTTRSVAAG